MSHLNLDLTFVGSTDVSLVVAMLSIKGCLLLYLLQLTAVKVFLELKATDFGTPVAEGLKIVLVSALVPELISRMFSTVWI